MREIGTMLIEAVQHQGGRPRENPSPSEGFNLPGIRSEGFKLLCGYFGL